MSNVKEYIEKITVYNEIAASFMITCEMKRKHRCNCYYIREQLQTKARAFVNCVKSLTDSSWEL